MFWRSERKRWERVFRKCILKVADFEDFGMPYCTGVSKNSVRQCGETKTSKEVMSAWWQGINTMTDESNERCKKVIHESMLHFVHAHQNLVVGFTFHTCFASPNRLARNSRTPVVQRQEFV
jgi:hypothetical protein